MSDLAAPVAISGPLKPYVVWLDTEKHSRIGLPLYSMRRLAGRLFTTSRQFVVGAGVGAQVHRPLRICLRGSCSCPMCLCTVSRIDRNPSPDSWFVCAAITSMGSSSITLCSFFRSASFSGPPLLLFREY